MRPGEGEEIDGMNWTYFISTEVDEKDSWLRVECGQQHARQVCSLLGDDLSLTIQSSILLVQ